MAVVELCDRVVSLLAPLLTSGRTKIRIQHQNIGEWHCEVQRTGEHITRTWLRVHLLL